MNRLIPCIAIVILSLGTLEAQPAAWKLGASAYGSITLAARLETRPDAAIPEDRSIADAYNGMWGGGASVRVPFADGEFFVQLSAEYGSRMRTTQRPYGTPGGAGLARVDEGIRFIPVELGVHSIVPLGSERLQASIALGVGAYFAERILRIENVRSHSENTSPDVNLFAGFVFGYRAMDGVMIEADLHFRDPEIECRNRFDDGTIIVQGISVPLPSSTLPSRIIVDGMRFSLGLVWEIP